jgi:hypothetical protein
MKFNPGLTINSNEPPVWVIFDGTVSNAQPTSLAVTVEASANTLGIQQTIDMYNWQTNQYQQVDSRTASVNSDSVAVVDLTPSMNQFIQNGTGAVRTRIGWKSVGPIVLFPWTICIDRVGWIVSQ